MLSEIFFELTDIKKDQIYIVLVNITKTFWTKIMLFSTVRQLCYFLIGGGMLLYLTEQAG